MKLVTYYLNKILFITLIVLLIGCKEAISGDSMAYSHGDTIKASKNIPESCMINYSGFYDTVGIVISSYFEIIEHIKINIDDDGFLDDILLLSPKGRIMPGID